jgi:hypothetical protein
MNLLQVRTYVRTLLDEDTAAFWSDAQINEFINRSFMTVYTQIAQSQRGYFETTGNITYVAGTELYSLATMAPLGFIRLSLLERVDQPPNQTLLPIDISEKNDYAQVPGEGDTMGYEKYFMSGNNLGIAPVPQVNITNVLKVWYVPVPAKLVLDADVFPADLTEVHHECIAQGAYMRCCQRDKQLLAIVVPVYKDLLDLCKADTQIRIGQEPRRVIDTDKNWS